MPSISRPFARPRAARSGARTKTLPWLAFASTALLADVLDRRCYSLAGILPFDLPNDRQERQKHLGNRLERVDPVPNRDEVAAIWIEQVFVNRAQIAKRARQPVQLRDEHRRDRPVRVLDRLRHPLKRGPIGILRRETAINENLFDDPTAIGSALLDRFALVI